MASFRDFIERSRAEDAERGYRMSDMNSIRKKLVEDKRTWTRVFDEYIEILLKEHPSWSATQITTKAAEVATERQSVIDEAFKNFPAEDD